MARKFVRISKEELAKKIHKAAKAATERFWIKKI